MATKPQPVPPGQSQAPEKRPTPDRIFQALFRYRLTAALKGAIDLDLFTAIGEGKHTAESIALRVQGSVRGVRILCDFLSIEGLLEKRDDQYYLAPDSAAFLDRRSPMFLGSAASFLADPELTCMFDNLAETVRHGGTRPEDATLQPENPLWVDFAHHMAGIAAFGAEMVAQLLERLEIPATRVLDIAAGHGMYGITLARHYLNAHVTALDWQNVLAVAAENAKGQSIGGRFHQIAGSAFEVDLGTGYDIVLITNFLHHFDVPTNESFLRRVHQALAPGGRAVVVDFVPNSDRITPPEAGAFAITMLATTPEGDAYTFEEYRSMFSNAGFASCELHPLPPTVQQVVIAQR